MPFSILAIFAHPDDEVTVGPLLARYARLGHRVRVVAVTAGQKGVRPHTSYAAGHELGAARIEEFRRACACLGIKPPMVLRFEDGEVAARGVIDQIIGELNGVVADLQPDVVITFGPEGASGHTDHRIISSAVTELVQKPGCPVRKLYYVAYPAAHNPDAAGDLLRRAMLARPVDTCLITTTVDCREDLEAADQAIGCHLTQWEPALMDSWSALNRTVLGGFVSLRLALSRVQVRAREDDILEGL